MYLCICYKCLPEIGVYYTGEEELEFLQPSSVLGIDIHQGVSQPQILLTENQDNYEKTYVFKSKSFM